MENLDNSLAIETELFFLLAIDIQIIHLEISLDTFYYLPDKVFVLQVQQTNLKHVERHQSDFKVYAPK